MAMGDMPAPYSWEGRRVIASILEACGYNQNTAAPLPLKAPEQEGTLEQVNELGIVASLVPVPEDEDEPEDEEEAESTFYPWSAVLYLRPQD